MQKRLNLLQCTVFCRAMFGRIYSIKYIAYIVNTLNARRSLSTGHTKKTKAEKALPSKTVKSRTEPLDFCACLGKFLPEFL